MTLVKASDIRVGQTVKVKTYGNSIVHCIKEYTTPGGQPRIRFHMMGDGPFTYSPNTLIEKVAD